MMVVGAQTFQQSEQKNLSFLGLSDFEGAKQGQHHQKADLEPIASILKLMWLQFGVRVKLF
jgi:hypothetical protein